MALAKTDPHTPPTRIPRDYILSWTDVIWIDRAIGRLAEHYERGGQGAHRLWRDGTDLRSSSRNSVQKFAAFPNGGGGHGEDVVWEQRSENGFISSHRVLKTGTHTGYWTYGPPTGRDFVSRTVAHCLVQDNRIVEEWLVRDEYAVAEALGLDPYRIAADLAARAPVTAEQLSAAPRGRRLRRAYRRPGSRWLLRRCARSSMGSLCTHHRLFRYSVERKALRSRHALYQ